MGKVILDDISKQFGDTPILNNINLTINDGEFLTLVGPSGCGKSTLLRIIAGLETASSGSTSIDDEVIDSISPSRRNLSMVFQSYALYPHLTVYDNIAVPLRMRWLNFWQRLPLIRRLLPGTRSIDTRISQRVEEAAESLGIQELLNRKPGQLSGGQRQRVAVGRALVRHPKAFLLDEPLSNLDAKLRVHMRAEIIQLHRKLAATFIYVTHDQAEAMTMSDRIAIMMNGELVQVGTPDEVYRNPQDIRVAEFIGSPKINVLVGEIQSSGYIKVLDRETDLIAEDQTLRGAISVAVRPEHLFISSQSHIDSFEVSIELIENLGAEAFIHASSLISSEKIVIKTIPDEIRHLELKQNLWLGFHPESVLIFDPQGKRISVGLADQPATEAVNA